MSDETKCNRCGLLVPAHMSLAIHADCRPVVAAALELEQARVLELLEKRGRIRFCQTCADWQAWIGDGSCPWCALAQRDEALAKARKLVVEVLRGDRTTDSWWTRVCNRCDAFQAADSKEGA